MGMTEASHYPETAQVADDLIANQLKMVRDEVVRGFDRQERYNDKLDSKFDKMVTKSEFNAEIGRVDAEKLALHREIQATKSRVDAGIDGVRKDMRSGFDEIKDSEKTRASKNRWTIGIMFTVITLIQTVVFNVVGALK